KKKNLVPAKRKRSKLSYLNGRRVGLDDSGRLGALIVNAAPIVPFADAGVGLERTRLDIICDSALNVQRASSYITFTAALCRVHDVEFATPTEALVVKVSDQRTAPSSIRYWPV